MKRSITDAAEVRVRTTLIFLSAVCSAIGAFSLRTYEPGRIAWAPEGYFGFGFVLFFAILLVWYEAVDVPHDDSVVKRMHGYFVHRASLRLLPMGALAYKQSRAYEVALVSLLLLSLVSLFSEMLSYLALIGVSGVGGIIGQLEHEEELVWRGANTTSQTLLNKVVNSVMSLYFMALLGAMIAFGWFISWSGCDLLSCEPSIGRSLVNVLGTYNGSFFFAIVVSFLGRVHGAGET